MFTLNDFKRMIAPVQRKIFLSLGRAILKAVYNDTDNDKKTQKLQLVLLHGETVTKIERFQEYGFETFPHLDSEAFAAFLNGDRSHGIVLCVHNREFRPLYLVSGEVVLYTDEDQNAEGHRIHFKRGQIIHIKCINKIIDAVGVIDENTNLKTVDAITSITETTALREEISNNSKEKIIERKTIEAEDVIWEIDVDVQITVPLFQITGATFYCTGNVKDGNATTPTMKDMRTAYNAHTHNYTDDGNPMVTGTPNTGM